MMLASQTSFRWSRAIVSMTNGSASAMNSPPKYIAPPTVRPVLQPPRSSASSRRCFSSSANETWRRNISFKGLIKVGLGVGVTLGFLSFASFSCKAALLLFEMEAHVDCTLLWYPSIQADLGPNPTIQLDEVLDLSSDGDHIRARYRIEGDRDKAYVLVSASTAGPSGGLTYHEVTYVNETTGETKDLTQVECCDECQEASVSI